MLGVSECCALSPTLHRKGKTITVRITDRGKPDTEIK
jgi:hypothetical protein